MTPAQIERRVEFETDRANRALKRGEITQKERDYAMRQVNAWAEDEYNKIAVRKIADHVDGFDRDDFGDWTDQ